MLNKSQNHPIFVLSIPNTCRHFSSNFPYPQNPSLSIPKLYLHIPLLSTLIVYRLYLLIFQFLHLIIIPLSKPVVWELFLKSNLSTHRFPDCTQCLNTQPSNFLYQPIIPLPIPIVSTLFNAFNPWLTSSFALPPPNCFSDSSLQ